MRTTIDNNPVRNTRERILLAAEGLFTEKGFRQTTVQDIAKRARCVTAAVNYHFRDKESLYLAAFLGEAHAMRVHVTGAIARLLKERGRAVTTEMLLHEFVGTLLRPFLDGSSEGPRAGLLARESQDPHIPQEIYEKNLAQAIVDTMTDALQSLYPQLSDERAVLCIESVTAQLQDLALDRAQGRGCRRNRMHLDVEERIRHLVEFSAAGIERCVAARPLA